MHRLLLFFLLSFLPACVSSHPRPANYEPPPLETEEQREAEPQREAVVIWVEHEPNKPEGLEELRRLER